MVTYAVLIPTHNEYNYISSCLQHVLQLQPPPSLILVVDDNSTDNTVGIVRSHPSVRLLSLHYPRHPTRGINLCWVMNAALIKIHRLLPSFQYLLKVDADSLTPPDYFSKLKQLLDANPQLGIVSGVPSSQHVSPRQASDGAKLYRRACLDSITPFTPMHGFDSFAIQQAHYQGWEVDSYQSVQYQQLRPFGPRDLMGWFLMGQNHFLTGYTLPYMFALVPILFLDHPYVLGSLVMLLSYLVLELTKTRLSGMDNYYRFMCHYSGAVITEFVSNRIGRGSPKEAWLG